MKIWNSIKFFLLSDLYIYICFGMTLICLVGLIVLHILARIKFNKDFKKYCERQRKYGIPEDYEAPSYVWNHIDYLLWLCDEYNLDSLYEAQDKFNELHASHWNYIKCSEEINRKLQSLTPDEREFALRALRHGESVERKNNIEENNDV